VPEYLLQQIEQMKQPQLQPQQEHPQAWAARIRQEAARTQFPEGFDFETAKADRAFVEMLMEMPVKRAAELYHYQKQAALAPQRIADQLMARQAIPQTERPGAPVQTKIDFMAMSDDEFDKFEAEQNKRRYR
jgi:hypothetical protein